MDLYHYAAILNFSHRCQCHQTEAEKQNSPVPTRKMIISIKHYCWLIRGTLSRWRHQTKVHCLFYGPIITKVFLHKSRAPHSSFSRYVQLTLLPKASFLRKLMSSKSIFHMRLANSCSYLQFLNEINNNNSNN